MDNNIYKKEGRRYVPIGLSFQGDYLTDGIWFVKHHKYGRSITSVPYMASLFHMNTEPVELNLLVSLNDSSNEILNSEGFRELMKNGYTVQDIVNYCVKYIYNKNNKKENENNN